MLAKQRLGEGQYESASKFAKLVDKVSPHGHFFSVYIWFIPLLFQKLRLSEDAHKTLSATKVEPLLKTLQNKSRFKYIFNLEKGMQKIHRDVMMALRPALKITRWEIFSHDFKSVIGNFLLQ